MWFPVRLAVVVVLVVATAVPAGAAPVVVPVPTGAHVPGTTDEAVPGVFELPVADGPVVRLFAAPAQRWGPGHRGVDLAVGADGVVRAPADGTISWAGHVVDRGVLTIAHPGGLRSSLEPVTSLHTTGTAVHRGQPVAVVAGGRSHCVPTCVHWGVRRGTGRAAEYLDPLGLLGRRAVRLLPWAA